MTRTFDFHIDLYLIRMQSYAELCEASGRDKEIDMIKEALGCYALYEEEVLTLPRTNMVLYSDPNNYTTYQYFNDNKREDHCKFPVTIPVPVSELEGLPAEVSTELVNEKIMRALIIYEYIKLGEADGLKLGIFNHDTRTLTVFKKDAVQTGNFTPDRHVRLGTPGMHLN